MSGRYCRNRFDSEIEYPIPSLSSYSLSIPMILLSLGRYLKGYYTAKCVLYEGGVAEASAGNNQSIVCSYMTCQNTDKHCQFLRAVLHNFDTACIPDSNYC